MLKVIEVLADSNKSWEDAAQQAVAEAGKSLRNVKSLYVKNFQAKVENDQIVEYRINGQLSFELDDQHRHNQQSNSQSESQQSSDQQQSSQRPEQQFTG